MALPLAGVELVAKGLSDFLGDMRKAGRAVDDFTDVGKRGFGVFGEMATGALRRVGELATDALVDASRAAAGFVKDGISAAGDVEQTLNVLQVAGKATDAQMAEVSKRALALGADLTLPATSAADASTAMLELTKAGFSVDQAMAGAKGTLQLAAAAETDAATAAQVMSGALNAFGLDASNAIHITDLLAGAANASQANIADLSQGFNQAGFAFHQAGFSADDLATSLAVLTKNGLTGSDAGTALKNALMRLFDPTDKAKGVMNDLGFSAYNAQGVMKPWPQLIAELQQATAKLTPEQRNQALGNIFLSDGMKAMTPLLNLSKDGLAAMYTEVTAAGQAAELSGAKMKGWNGVIEGFNSTMETLGIIIGQNILPIITPLGQKLNEAIGAIASGDYTTGFAKLSEFFTSVVAEIQKFFSELATGTSPLSPFLNSLVDALRPVGAMITEQASVWFSDLWEWLKREAPRYLEPFGDMLVEQASKWFHQLNTWIETQGPVILEQLRVWGEQFSAWIEPMIPPLMAELDKLVAKLGDALEERKPAIMAKLGEWGRAAALALGQAIIDGIVYLGVALGNWIIEQEPFIAQALNLWASQLAGWVNNGIIGMLEGLGRMWDGFKGWLNDTANNILHEAGIMGENLIKGFVEAIGRGANWVRDAAANMAIAARDAAFSALGVGSPSKVFAQIGQWTAEGMQMGIQAGTPAVQQATAAMASPVAYPGGGGGSTAIDNSRQLTYAPVYGAAVSPSPQRDSAVARSMALW